MGTGVPRGADEIRPPVSAPAGDAGALARAVAELAEETQQLAALGAQARASYERFFAAERVKEQLRAALAGLALRRG